MKSPFSILKRWGRWLVPWRNSIYGCSPSIPEHLEMDSFRFTKYIYRYNRRVRHKCKQKLQLKFSTLRSAQFIQLYYSLIPFWCFFFVKFYLFSVSSAFVSRELHLFLPSNNVFLGNYICFIQLRYNACSCFVERSQNIPSLISTLPSSLKERDIIMLISEGLFWNLACFVIQFVHSGIKQFYSTQW